MRFPISTKNKENIIICEDVYNKIIKETAEKYKTTKKLEEGGRIVYRWVERALKKCL